MKAITKFLDVLSENYYEKFLVENPFIDEDLFKKYYWEVEYKNKTYFELNIDEISLEIEDVLNKIQHRYNKAISEVYRLISNKNSKEIYSIIENLKKSMIINLEVIKSDFYMDDPKSRYYSVTVYSNQYFSIQEALIELSKNINLGRNFNSIEAHYGAFDLLYDNKRYGVFSYLCTTLFTIGKAFIIDLEKIKENAISNEFFKSVSKEEKLKWDSKPAHLGYIMGMLADLEFVNAPKRKNGDINYTQYARQVLNIFDIETTENTLTKYLNTTTEKAQETERNFNKANFNIPHKKEVN